MESQRSLKKIFVTGGHYTPAKAVVGELGNFHVFYVGRKHALEGDKALSLEFQEMSKRSDVTFLTITTGRFQRKFTKNTIPSLFKIPIGFAQSLYWIIKYQPDAVMCFGGYVAIPVATVAKAFGIPIVNHEQIPAFDYPSKYLNWLATKVLVSFPHLVKTNEIYTGNPVRQDIFSPKVKHPKTIYITGGSQGSHIINSTVLDILPELLKKYHIIWQTGDSQEYNDFAKIPPHKNLVVQKFFSSTEIGSVFSKSDVVISRSGANTVTELAALGKPAILIPIPWVHDAEQLKNAESLAAFGGSKIILQADLTPKTLLATITDLMTNHGAYEKKSQAAKALFVPDAAHKIVSALEEVVYAKKA